MSFKYQVGDKVRVKSLPCGTEEDVAIGDIAIVVEVDQGDPEGLTYLLESERWDDWWFSEQDIESHLNTREYVIEEIHNTLHKLVELHKLLETFE